MAERPGGERARAPQRAHARAPQRARAPSPQQARAHPTGGTGARTHKGKQRIAAGSSAPFLPMQTFPQYSTFAPFLPMQTLACLTALGSERKHQRKEVCTMPWLFPFGNTFFQTF